MTSIQAWQPELKRAQLIALIAGIGGLLVCGLGVWLDPEQFFQSYLVAYLFWLGLALGCFGVMVLHHMTGGTWGVVIRRVLEAGTMLLPLMALLFVPLAFGLHTLYPWARPELVAQEEVLQHRSALYNGPAFLVRTAIYFAIWITIAFLLRRWSLAQDRTAEPIWEVRMRLLSRAGAVLYVFGMTFAAWDWAMSLEQHWYSTIYGVLFVSRQGLAGLAFAIALMGLLAQREPLSQIITPEHFHDLGNLLLAFVMLWAYMNLSQFLIIWSGNLPEEVTWYIARIEGGWGWVARFLLVFQFVLPFFILLSRRAKQRIGLLATLAIAIVGLYLIDLFWVIMPSFHDGVFFVHWLDLAAPVGIGGIWIALFLWQLMGQPLIPPHDRRSMQMLQAK